MPLLHMPTIRLYFKAGVALKWQLLQMIATAIRLARRSPKPWYKLPNILRRFLGPPGNQSFKLQMRWWRSNFAALAASQERVEWSAANFGRNYAIYRLRRLLAI
jgi:hypothetical protein